MSDHSDRIEALTELRYVGPATAATLAARSVAPDDVREKRVSYQMLVDWGINPGVATKIRRWHSLPWTFDSDETHLDRRSETVRGLREGEREWVAASVGGGDRAERDRSDEPLTDADWTPGDDRSGSAAGSVPDDSPLTAGDWRPASSSRSGDDAPEAADGSGAASDAESAWRDRSRSDAVTAVPGITDAIAETLSEAGVTTARRLATIDPDHVADVADADPERVRSWRDAAAEYVALR